MSDVRRALDFTLRQQEPFPALVVDGHWNLLMSNQGAQRLIGALRLPRGHGRGGWPPEPRCGSSITRAACAPTS